MKSPFKALIMSVGMFSILPLPRNHWDERSLPWVLSWMPVVGALIGLAWYGVVYATPGMSPSLRAAFVLLTPFVLSGFLHLDGFMDTADAVFSRRDLEERRRILKDSHVGAFAVISLVCLYLLQFCAIETILSNEKSSVISFLFIPIVSRCVVGVLLLRMKPMSETGFAAMFQANTGYRHLALPSAILIGVFSVALPFGNIAILLVEAFVAAATMFYLRRHFQGTSGDLCGCSIILGELSALLTLALT